MSNFNNIWDTLKNGFVAIYEMGFVIDYYGWKSDLADNIGRSLLYEISTHSVKCYTRYMKSPLMSMRKLVIFCVQYGFKLELQDKS